VSVKFAFRPLTAVLAISRFPCEIPDFGTKEGLRGLPIWRWHYNFSPTDSCCHGNKN